MSRSLLDQAGNGILDLLISQALEGVGLFGSALCMTRGSVDWACWELWWYGGSRGRKERRRKGLRTVSGVDLGLGASGLADEDGNAGVVALHGWVGPGDE